MKIVSVRDKRVRALVDNASLTSVKGFSGKETRKIIEMLGAIRMMAHPLELRAVAAWRAHELLPFYPGKWALWVTPNYRLTFEVDIPAQEVRLLDYEDYH